MFDITEKRKKKTVWLWVFGDWHGHRYRTYWFNWGEVVGFKRFVLWLIFIFNTAIGVGLACGYIWLMWRIGDLTHSSLSILQKVFVMFLFYVALPALWIATFGVDCVRLFVMLMRKKR